MGIGVAIGVSAAAGLGLAGAAISSSAASKAAEEQSTAYTSAAELEYKAAQEALDFEKEQYATTQEQQAPFLEAGTEAVSKLSDLAGTQQYTEQFTAPTEVTEQNDPGYQFRLAEGTKALERSAAAKGGLLTGGTAKAIEKYGQDYASNEYSNVYNRALQNYQTNYNVYANERTNAYNELAALAGVGQTSANTLASTGTSTANSVANTLTSSASNQASALTDAATARASGYVGGANAWSNSLSGIGENISSALLLKKILGK
jgi:hypothetical protein